MEIKESPFLHALKKLDSSFEYTSDDTYVSDNFELSWLENDLYQVDLFVYDNDIGGYNVFNEGVMGESRILNYIKTYLNGGE